MRSLTLSIIAAFACVPVAGAETVAIVGGTVHTLTDAGVIEHGTVLIQDSRITAVGSEVAIPGDARVIDATGKVVTPGLMAPHTTFGVEEITVEEKSVDYGLEDERFGAAFSVAEAINPRSIVIREARIRGVTRAVVAPTHSGPFAEEPEGALAGQGAVIHLGSTEDFVVRNPSGLYFIYGEEGAEVSGGARGGALLRLREALDDAIDYGENRAAWEQGDRRSFYLHRLDLEALQPLLSAEIPLVTKVHRASDIETMIELATEYGLELVIVGGREAWMVADQLAAANVAAVINPLENTPASFESMGSSLENAAILDEAGVRMAFMIGDDPHNQPNIKQAAGNAVAHGLAWEAALRAITVNPAEIFGVDRGALAAWQDADVVVWDGDPLEVTTYADHVFIRGVEIPMVSRSTLLFERYEKLEFEYPPAYRN